MRELSFVLPVGLPMSDGRLYRHGVMRAATALDEIEPLGDERVRRNEAYFPLLLLARVITQLGPLSPATPEAVAALPAADFAYLQELYEQLNSPYGVPAPLATTPAGAALPNTPVGTVAQSTVEAECPHCGALLELELGDGT